MNYSITIRFSRFGEFENAETYTVDIPEDTKEDDEVEALMDAIRPDIEEMYEEEDDWDNGDISWELFEWNKI